MYNNIQYNFLILRFQSKIGVWWFTCTNALKFWYSCIILHVHIYDNIQYKYMSDKHVQTHNLHDMCMTIHVSNRIILYKCVIWGVNPRRVCDGILTQTHDIFGMCVSQRKFICMIIYNTNTWFLGVGRRWPCDRHWGKRHALFQQQRAVMLANPYPSWVQSRHGLPMARPLLLSLKGHSRGNRYGDVTSSLYI